MITFKELLQLPPEEIDRLMMIIDSGKLNEPFDPKQIEFSVDDYKYRCEFVLGSSEKNPDEKILGFKFIVVDDTNKLTRDQYLNVSQREVAIKKWSLGVLQVEHPLRALEHALLTLLRYVRSYKPKYVSFISDDPNQQRLYKKFYEYYGHYASQYKMCDKNPETGEELGDEEFWLERK